MTAAFLLIMGAVSTIVLGKRLGNEFNTQLVAAAQHTPQQIASNPGDYVAVEITGPPGPGAAADRQLRGDQGTGRRVQNLITRHVARYYVARPAVRRCPGTDPDGPGCARWPG